MKARLSLVFPLLLAFVFALPLPAGAAGDLPGDTTGKISPWVLDALREDGSTDFFVVLTEQADLTPAYSLPNKLERGRWVYRTLWETAERTQAPLRAWLDARRVPYRPYYIVNLIYVRAGSRALVQTLAAREDVARIEANPRIHNEFPRPILPEGPEAPASIEWNIQKVNAPAVWAMGYTGEGVVVGGQDTGYDWDHPALVNQYRGWDGSSANHDYNWHDAIHSGGGSCGADSPEPCDDYGHGTHTMGTVVGDDGGSNQVGMAPGARWIGCRNMDVGTGSPATYLECFEFFLAPYPVNGTPAQGDPDLAPDVTNNSWGCPPSEGCSWSTLQSAVEAQRAAGIMTVVSAGNSGSGCSSVEDPPAIYDASYSVGATDSSDSIAYFSSRGPVTVDGSGRLKPDISAPGVGVRSSVPGGGYGSMSGTSMAGPHVAGAVALLWSAAPDLRSDITATEQVLNTTAVPRYSTQCGDPANTVPNNVYGWGRLDVLAAVRQALAGGQGHLRGSVVVAGTLAYPIQEAIVHAITDTVPYTTTTDADGEYSLTLAPDVYTVSAWKYGYRPETVTGVEVAGGVTTTVSFSLTVAAPYTVTGCVSDTLTGEPLTATISVTGPFGTPVTETVATGCYTLTLRSSPYTFVATAPRHQPATASLDLVADTVQNFLLDPLDGLLWGYVTNRETGNPVVGAKVQVEPGGQGGNSAADGRYEIPLPPGVYTVTTSAPLYGTVVETDVVIPTATQVRRDYALPAPHLSLLPLVMLSVTLDYKGVTTETLTVSNTGSLSLTFTVDEPIEPWLSVTPLGGVVPPGASFPLSVTFDASAVAYGVFLADLRFRTDDPEAQPYRDYSTRMEVLPPPPRFAITKGPSSPTVEVGLGLTYTLVVSNAGGPATGVVVSDVLPARSVFAWADGGVLDGDTVIWSGLSVADGGRLTLTYGVTVTCVPSGTPVVNALYGVQAAEWTTMTFGSPVTVTTRAAGVVAAFDYSVPLLARWPVTFVNRSQNGAAYEWDFGDGVTSTLAAPTHVYTGAGRYTVTLTVVNACFSATVGRMLTVGDYGLVLSPTTISLAGRPGATVTYTLRVTNTGTFSTVPGLSLGDHLWPTEVLSPTTGVLSPGYGTDFGVRVSVPVSTAEGARDVVTVTVVALSDPRVPPVSAGAVLTTTVEAAWEVYLPLVLRSL